MEKTKIKIAALQMGSVIGNLKANQAKVRELLCRSLLNKSPNIIILPEVWSVGWDCEKFIDSAEEIPNSSVINLLSELAKEFNSYIIGGSFIEKDGDNYYNTAPVISDKGEVVTLYRKNHLFSYYGCNEGSYVLKGVNPVLVDVYGLKIGLSICYDIRFPELYRAYRMAGADLLVNMAAWPLGRKIHWDALTRARAVENQCFLVALTQSGVLTDGSKNLGHSYIYDYNGEILDSIIDEEGIMYAEISTEQMYEFREKCTVLNDIHTAYEVIKC